MKTVGALLTTGTQYLKNGLSNQKATELYKIRLDSLAKHRHRTHRNTRAKKLVV